jgi:signal transduction histidine kinase
MWKSRSIARTVLVSMLLVALVPLLIMAIQGYHCASMAVVELRTAHLRSVLNGQKSRIEDWLRERQTDLVALASYPCIWGSCSDCAVTDTNETHCAVCQLLDRTHERSVAYQSLVVYSLDWRRVNASKQTVHSDENLLDPEFREAVAHTTEPVATPPHFHEGGEIGIHMGFPIHGSDGQKLGFMLAALDLSTTVHPILQDRTGFGDTTRTYIVSSDGRYFSRPSEDVHALAERALLPEGLLRGRGDGPYTYPDCMGRTVIGVSSQIPDLGWVLVAEIDRAEAFAWLSSLRLRAAVTGLVTLVLVIALALRSSHRVTIPLKKLAKVANEVSSGNTEKRLGELRGREPQDVATAFNKMLDDLSNAHRDLVQAASLAAVGELSSSIVHEMRNPLSSVKMNIKALREKVADDPTYSELAEIAAGQTERLEAMLNDLLQFGKPVELHRESLALENLFEDVSVALGGLAAHHGVEIVREDRTEGASLLGDREQLRRALTNLVDNAVRVSSAGSVVRMSGSTEESETGVGLVVHVDDAGPGLSDTVRERLFEPFFTSRGDGTGLGLANVRKIVELHRGTVTGENRPDGGARFTVRLPLGDVS